MLARLVGAVAKRLPSHAKDRIEEALLGLRDFERLPVPRQSALTIVCDDGELNDLDVVQVLDRHGVKGVFAVSPDLIGRPGFLDYEQLRRLRADGHEIAFHGTTHDPFTGFADRAALLKSVGRGMRQLEAEALGTPSTLIYPFGRHNRAVRQAVSAHFHCAFTTWFGINQGAANRYAIRRIPFGAYTGKLPATEAWYRGLLERSAAGGCWPTLMLHPAAPGHTATHHALLSRLIDHAKNLGMPVQTVVAHLGPAMADGPVGVPVDTAQRS
ncbi:MAG: polysaccharide deacetylase family protein [Burkholderiaceae bacterium]|nr:polysaccharide deacetylase family protein [Burkholderiaceae bacterium]